MDIKQKLILKISIGFSLGIIVLLIFMIASSPPNLDISDSKTIENYVMTRDNMISISLNLIASGLYGALAMGGSILYELENWSILKATLTHYLTILLSYYIIGFGLDWFSSSDFMLCGIIFLIFTVSYFFIWFFQYLKYKTEVKEINIKLKNLKITKENN